MDSKVVINYRMNEQSHRGKVLDEQIPFVNRETDGMLKQENRKASERPKTYKIFAIAIKKSLLVG